MIFGAIAAAWLVYLVPIYLRRNGQSLRDTGNPLERFSSSVRIIRDGNAPEVDQAGIDQADGDSIEVSTPLTRRAAIAELHRGQQAAARRRRRVLVCLALALATVLVFCVIGRAPWWALAIPGGLMVAFIGVARFSVIAMNKAYAARFARITGGVDEDTVTVSPAEAAGGSTAKQVEVGAPKEGPGSLWDPLPITVPTYVSKPLAPRTVRTIDLSGPESARQMPIEPVLAEPQAPVAEAERTLPRAVGE